MYLENHFKTLKEYAKLFVSYIIFLIINQNVYQQIDILRLCLSFIVKYIIIFIFILNKIHLIFEKFLYSKYILFFIQKYLFLVTTSILSE